MPSLPPVTTAISLPGLVGVRQSYVSEVQLLSAFWDSQLLAQRRVAKYAM
jgi:hypothetical protein